MDYWPYQDTIFDICDLLPFCTCRLDLKDLRLDFKLAYKDLRLD